MVTPLGGRGPPKGKAYKLVGFHASASVGKGYEAGGIGHSNFNILIKKKCIVPNFRSLNIRLYKWTASPPAPMEPTGGSYLILFNENRLSNTGSKIPCRGLEEAC